MSDLGLLSKQYKELQEFLGRLRQWTTVIKKAHYQIGESIEVAELAQAADGLSRVSKFLRHVIPAEDEGEWGEEWIIDPALPIDVVEKIREAHSSNQALYLEQLSRLTSHLENDPRQLTNKDIAILDSIMLATSADVNEVFRRMMRWV